MKFLSDFFPILLFFIAYKLYGIYVATAVAIASSFVQVGVHWLKHRRFENMHLITLGLLVVLGGATLILQDKAFIMWKPTAINWLFAVVFLGSMFIGKKPLVERMMSHAVEAPSGVWMRLNISWVLFFIAMGFANLYVANFYFQAETLLNTTAGYGVDLATCVDELNGSLLELCHQAQEMEENWVNFKLFGMMGLTLAFVLGQAFYLAKHIKEEPETK
ncbi:MAG: septation protein A [Gammaproteobacteria bacterium]|nr:septation protein A [Gammaproteobacteria bacterium]